MTETADLTSGAIACDTVPAVSMGWTTSAMISLSCATDTEDGIRQLRKLLALGAGIIIVLEALSYVRLTWYGTPILPEPSLLCAFELILSFVALAATRLIRLGSSWQWWVMGFCFVFIASRTYSNVAFQEWDGPLAISLLVVIVVSALLVPWSGWWQITLGLLSIASFTVGSFIGTIEPLNLDRSIMLVLIAIFAASFAALRESYRHQSMLVGQLEQSDERLREEVLEHQRAARSAEEQRETLRKVFEASPDAMAVLEVGATGQFVDVNEEFLKVHGYSRDEVIGKTPMELNLTVDPTVLVDFTQKLEAEGQARNTEVAWRRKNGEVIQGLLSAVLVNLNEKQYSVGVMRDITERKRNETELILAREAAETASKAKSEFLSSMSHEIRTPMNAVLGMAELLGETELSEDQRHYLEVMVANGNSLLDLINSILDLARIESGRMQIETTEFDLAELVDRTISTFGVRAHSKGLELVARIAPGVPDRLVGDPLRLRQVLMNLLGNAIKFTELGEVVLEVDRNPESSGAVDLIFSVADSGIGIAQDKLDTIFSTFTQADSSTTRKYGGSGLGLAIAQRLVGLMHGRLSVESEVNKGSRFSFSLPLGAAERVINPSAQVLLSLAGYRVLVVDDNHLNRLIALENLASCGAEVAEADSGESALRALHQAAEDGRPYRIVLLDMRMPGMDGLEVARRIRDERLPLKPLVLMLSSDDIKLQIERLKELGLDAYLIKPITRRELFEAIRRVLHDARKSANAAAVETLPVRAASGETGLNILTAEDSPDNRLVIAAYLRHQSHHLDFAENGSEALDKFTTHQYDLVLMDIQMPMMDGLEATRKIRQWEMAHNRPPVPIVALTAYALEDDVKRALAAGCDLHLSKPIKKTILLDCIHRLGRASKDSRENVDSKVEFTGDYRTINHIDGVR
ncbi:MAG TPA: response regulator [Candidatus Binataceae bacterium]|nr:response regulator [Candidatus Binataceae bacterium]